MNSLKQIALVATFAAIATSAGAQVPALVPVPFGQVFAGIAPGGTATQCSSSVDYPTATGTFGNVTRNSLTGPAYINLNASIIKRLQLPGEGHILELKLDGFNVFNTPNLANPGSSLASSTSANVNFGIITNTVGTNGVVGSNGRRVQIGGILQF